MRFNFDLLWFCAEEGLWSIWKTNRNVAEKHTLIMLGSTSTYQSKPFISKGTIWVNNPSNNSTSKETAE